MLKTVLRSVPPWGVIEIIIGVLTFDGLILTFADIVIDLAGGSLILTILLFPGSHWFSGWSARSPPHT